MINIQQIVKRHILLPLVLTCITLSSVACQSTIPYAISPVSEKTAVDYKLDTTFYKKTVMVENILIATSEKVSDYACLEAAYQFEMMMKSIRPEIAQRIREKKVLCILVAHNEVTSDVPQFGTNKVGQARDFYNWRQRGFLTWKNGLPIVLFSEEDVLEYEGGMQLESILIHEFGHVIHGAGFDKDLQARLTTVYKEAVAKGLWNDGRAAQRFRRVKSETPVSLLTALIESFPKQSPKLLEKCLNSGDILVNGQPTNANVKVTKDDKVLIVFGGEKKCYASRNRAEYFAEGVQCWYNTNRTMDHDHNHIHTREQLIKYDSGLAKLCEDVLGNTPWRFVSPRERAGKNHLRGYDPTKAPKVEQPEHIKEAANLYYDKYWGPFWKRLQDKHGIGSKD